MNHNHHDDLWGRRRPGSVTATDEHSGTGTGSGPADPSARLDARPAVWAAVWNAITAVIATIAGMTPHVLHHIGLFAGAFLVTGAAANLLFGVAGLALSIPLLRRLYRRFRTWKAPAIAASLFAVMFSVSAFVIGPAISESNAPPTPAPSQGVSPGDGHGGHHS